MPMPRPMLTVAALLLAAPAAGQGLPASLEAFAAERARECQAAGGQPRVGPAFATSVDLNGDGAPDYIVDLAGIECANAWSTFCQEAGCPVSVWLTGAGGPVRVWSGAALGWRIDAAEADIGILVDQQEETCEGGPPCRQRLVFDQPAPAAPPAPPVPAQTAAPSASLAAPAEPAAAPAVPVPPLAPPPGEGWSVRPNGAQGPLAISAAPSPLASIALLCHEGAPWAAVGFDGPPPSGPLEIAFAFPAERVVLSASPEASLGGAFAVLLSDTPLARRLAGRDTAVEVSLAGQPIGTLSLRGSTRAIRDATEACQS